MCQTGKNHYRDWQSATDRYDQAQASFIWNQLLLHARRCDQCRTEVQRLEAVRQSVNFGA